MNNIKQLSITLFSSCEDSQGTPAVVNTYELVNRVFDPVRTLETTAEYHSFSKSKQGKIKDVGGYIMGDCMDGSRKGNAINSRSALVFDHDKNVPQNLPQIYAAQNYFYILYPTHSFLPEAPKYRAIIPLDRPVTPDEYGAIGRKLAHDFFDASLQMFDKVSFLPTQIMYWPSCCADAHYQAYYGDKPFLSADGMLSLYPDWHDVNAWPYSATEQKSVGTDAARKKKQEDPTQKTGVIGALCRLYDVPRANEELIPGIYLPTDSPDRYTYSGGSTTGGAVVYENGTFLYSHHSTDPCCGKLCNVFDLVKIHKFGALDKAAKPDTPTTSMPSFKAMCAFAESLPDVKLLIEIEKGAAIVAEFGTLTQQIENNPDKKAALGRLDGQTFTTDLAEQLLDVVAMSTQLNVISNKAVITGAPLDWSPENAVNNLPTLLRDILRRAGVCGVTKDAIMDSLALINDRRRFNPVLDMLYSASWDGIDRLPVVNQILGKTDALSNTLIKKWLWQCVAMAHNDSIKPYGADGVLTLVGTQGLGKTSFFRWLAMKPSWFVEGASLDMNNKDSIIQALRGWITELGELDGILRRDVAALKAFLTQLMDNIRAPYARSAVERPRHTSFCATVNDDEFLKDETGNRRFWTVPVEAVDLDLMRRLDTAWVQQLWAQVLKLYESNPQGFRLAPDERRQLEEVNMQHMQPLPYEEETLDRLDFSLPFEKWTEVSASQIAERIYPHPDSGRIGRVLAKIARTDSRIQIPRSGKKRSYLLPLKNYSYGFPAGSNDSNDSS